MLSTVYHKIFSHKFVRFLLVGSVGFVINYIFLTITYRLLHIPIFISQLLSAEIALLATFTGNNFWAFRGHHHISIKSKLLKYHLTSGSGIIINTLIVGSLVKYAGLYYGLALVCGTFVGLVWNYIFNIKLIFKTERNSTQA